MVDVDMRHTQARQTAGRLPPAIAGGASRRAIQPRVARENESNRPVFSDKTAACDYRETYVFGFRDVC